MTTQQRNGYRLRLRELSERLGTSVEDLRGEALRPLGSESANGTGLASVHDADLGSQAAAGDLALELLAPESEVLAEVNAALDRVRLGTFGLCETCSKPIGLARLTALPYARRCIRCTRAADAPKSEVR